MPKAGWSVFETKDNPKRVAARRGASVAGSNDHATSPYDASLIWKTLSRCTEAQMLDTDRALGAVTTVTL